MRFYEFLHMFCQITIMIYDIHRSGMMGLHMKSSFFPEAIIVLPAPWAPDFLGASGVQSSLTKL